MSAICLSIPPPRPDLSETGGLLDDSSYFAVVLPHGDCHDPRCSRRRLVLAARQAVPLADCMVGSPRLDSQPGIKGGGRFAADEFLPTPRRQSDDLAVRRSVDRRVRVRDPATSHLENAATTG